MRIRFRSVERSLNRIGHPGRYPAEHWYREAAAFHREPAVVEVRAELSNTLPAEQANPKELA